MPDDDVAWPVLVWAAEGSSPFSCTPFCSLGSSEEVKMYCKLQHTRTYKIGFTANWEIVIVKIFLQSCKAMKINVLKYFLLWKIIKIFLHVVWPYKDFCAQNFLVKIFDNRKFIFYRWSDVNNLFVHKLSHTKGLKYM